MAQLTGVGIENFRVFKDFTEFEFAPITILTGTNSSGKSSLFKALLLLADNAQRNGLSELDFTGEGHQLGTFETVKTKGSEKEEMTFVLHYKFTAEELLNKYKLTFNNLNELTSEINEGVWFGILRDGYALHYTFKKEKCISYKVVIEKEGESHTIYQEEFFLDKKGKEYKQISKDIDLFIAAYNQSLLNYKIDKEPLSIDTIIKKEELANELASFDQESVILFLNQLNDEIKKLSQYTLSYYNYTHDIDDPVYGMAKLLQYGNVAEMTFKEVYAIKLFKDTKINEDYYNLLKDKLLFGDILPKDFLYLLKKVNAETPQIKFDLSYLEPVRATTQRVYLFAEGKKFNKALQKSTERLLSTQKEDITDDLFGASMKYFFKKWLKAFNIGTDIQVNNIKNIGYEVILTLKNGEKVDLADVGYGVTQVLPILLEIAFYGANGSKMAHIHTNCITNPNGAILYINEPEANLHPKLQSLLADCFVDAINTFNVTLLVETHSEYLIRKLQYLTAKKEVNYKDEESPKYPIQLIDYEDDVFVNNENQDNNFTEEEQLEYIEEEKRVENVLNKVKITTQEDVTAIYYFYEPDNVPAGKKQVERIRIQADGSLDNNFGTGFFDEADNLAIDLFNITKAQRN